MSINVKEIFKGNTANNSLISTDSFSNANLVFLVADDLAIGEGYEIAAALVISLKVTETFLNLPITTNYGEKEIPLDIDFLDTENIILIPDEAVKQQLDCYLVLATSYSIRLTAYAVQLIEPTNEELGNLLEEVKKLAESIKSNQESSDISLLEAVKVINVLLPFVGLPSIPLLPSPSLPIGLLPGL